MLLHNYLNSGTYTADLVKTKLSSIPNTEIKSIKKRVDFYVNHYKISAKSTNTESKEQQLSFLLNLNSILESEIQNRSFLA